MFDSRLDNLVYHRVIKALESHHPGCSAISMMVSRYAGGLEQGRAINRIHGEWTRVKRTMREIMGDQDAWG